MKKLMVFIMAAFMAVSFVGTASAVDFTRTLSAAGTLQFFASPVTESGVSVYLLAGQSGSGASVIAIDPTTGTSRFLVTSPTGPFIAGSTAFGTPAVLSGETLFVQVATSNQTSGTSLVAINGSTGATYYTVNIPQGTDKVFAGGFPGPALTTVTGWAAPLTLDPAGTTLYGTSGVSAPGTGVSIWSIRTATGAFSSFATGVSSIWAAPVLSGNSIFVLGNNYVTTGGVSLISFNKNTGATLAAVTLLGDVVSATPFATPALSGNSLFVVDATGGLTAYAANTLASGASDFIQFGRQAQSAVTASPITNGSFLVVTQNNPTQSQAGITVFDLSRPLSANTPWFFVWPTTGTTIVATPAISNGILYTAVNEPDGGRIDRFRLTGHSGRITDPDFTTILNDSNGARLGRFDFASPIIKSDRLILVSNGTVAAQTTPRLYSFDLDAGGTAAWPQFKFDAARTGNNTAAAVTPAAVGDDDSGCFISTIK